MTSRLSGRRKPGIPTGNGRVQSELAFLRVLRGRIEIKKDVLHQFMHSLNLGLGPNSSSFGLQATISRQSKILRQKELVSHILSGKGGCGDVGDDPNGQRDYLGRKSKKGEKTQ